MNIKPAAPLLIGLPVVTFVNGLAPLPQATVEIHCPAGYQSRCDARAPRPLNGPHLPGVQVELSAQTTSADARLAISMLMWDPKV